MHIINRACRRRVVAGLSEPDKRKNTAALRSGPLVRVRDPRYYKEPRIHYQLCGLLPRSSRALRARKAKLHRTDGRALLRVRDPRYYGNRSRQSTVHAAAQ